MKKEIIVSLLVVVILIAGMSLLVSLMQKAATAPSTAMDQTPNTTQPPASQPQGLKIEDVVVGTGEAAQNGDTVTVNYVGTLTDGTKFDSSYDRNQPFSFLLGASHVIKGWDLGVLGMKVGGKRKLTIPPELGYGAGGQGPIPPNATLLFTIELLKVVHPAK